MFLALDYRCHFNSRNRMHNTQKIPLPNKYQLVESHVLMHFWQLYSKFDDRNKVHPCVQCYWVKLHGLHVHHYPVSTSCTVQYIDEQGKSSTGSNSYYIMQGSPKQSSRCRTRRQFLLSEKQTFQRNVINNHEQRFVSRFLLSVAMKSEFQ